MVYRLFGYISYALFALWAHLVLRRKCGIRAGLKGAGHRLAFSALVAAVLAVPPDLSVLDQSGPAGSFAARAPNLANAGLLLAPAHAFTFPPLKLPFEAGPGRIIAGYAAGTHTGGDDYALDLCEGTDCTAGQVGQYVLAPTNITLVYSGPAFGMPTSSRDFHIFEVSSDSTERLCLSLAHVALIQGLDPGERMPQGAMLGTLVSYPPSVPHHHVGLWRVSTTQGCAGSSRQAQPFTGAYALDGVEYPTGGSQVGAVTSSNYGMCAAPQQATSFFGVARAVAAIADPCSSQSAPAPSSGPPAPGLATPTPAPPSQSNCTGGVATLTGPPSDTTITAGQLATFTWSPIAGCQSYRIEYWRDPNPPGPGYATVVQGTSYSFAPAETGAWRWQVRVVKNDGTFGDAPLARGFTVQSGGGANCNPTSDGPTLFEAANYTGSVCRTFVPGPYPSTLDIPDLSVYRLSGNVSSIRNPDNKWRVILNDGVNFGGQPGNWDQDVPDLNPHGWTDRARSLRVEWHGPTDCNQGTDGVIFSNDPDSQPGGGCITATANILDLSVYLFQRIITSLKFVGSYIAHYQVWLYPEANHGGVPCGPYWQDQSDLRDCSDKAVSVKIEPFTRPTDIPTATGTPVPSGNLAPLAYRDRPGSDAAVDGSLASEWIAGHKVSLGFSWAQPVTVPRIIVWDRSQSSTDNNQINGLTLGFSDGTSIQNIDMISAGPRCVDVTFPAKTVTWVNVIPFDASGTNGYREVEIWATCPWPLKSPR